MSPTTSKGRHAAKWEVLRVVKDRAYKFYTETPAEWGKRRALTATEKVQAFALAVGNAFAYKATRR